MDLEGKLTRKWRKRSSPPLQAQRLRHARDLLVYYAEAKVGSNYSKEMLWQIGYICGLRDAGLLNWDEWHIMVDEIKVKHHHERY